MPSLRVLGHSFECPLPYSEGHACTRSEAAELNRLRTQRIAIIARRLITAGVNTSTDALESLARTFEFCTPTFSIPSDPIEAESLKIARAIAAGKCNRSEYPERFEKLVAEINSSPDVRAEAGRRIARQRQVAAESLGLLEELGL